MPTPDSKPSRMYRLALLLWAGGTVLGSAAGIAQWILHIGGPACVLGNLAYILALPGWVPLYALGFSGVRDHPAGIVAAHALAWGVWAVLLLAVLKIRQRIVQDLPRSSEPSPEPAEPESAPDLARRRFMCNAALGVAGVAAVASPTYATLIEPWSIRVRRHNIPVRDLPRSLDGLRLAQFSDPHMGPRMPYSFIEQAAGLIMDMEPDLVLLTGDYIHDGTDDIERAAGMCGPMIAAAGIGAVGVLGNHDWWGDGPAMSRALNDAGVRMIDNDRVWIDADTRSLTTTPGGESLAIVGLGDLIEDTVDPARAFKGIDADTPRIVLAHHPDTAELASLTGPHAPRVDLMCSGHTHGGQVRIPLIGTPLVPSNYGSKYAGGLVAGPAFPVLVSRGIGMSLLPVRFGVPPEVTLITLSRA
ncbi:MAG: metallophosphoesterase [Phycisphaerales bacterium]